MNTLVKLLPHYKALVYGFQDNGFGVLVKAPCSTDATVVRFVFEDLH